MQKKALKKLIKLLDLETLEENLFRGQSENIGGPRVFGGQVIGPVSYTHLTLPTSDLV